MSNLGRWLSGDKRELQARWKRVALQVWWQSIHLDRIVRWDNLIYNRIPGLIAFVEKNGGRVDIRHLPAEMDGLTKRLISKRLRRYAGVFNLTYKHNRSEEWIEVGELFKQINAAEKAAIADRDEGLSVAAVKKLLMMCKERKVAVKKVQALERECAFPSDFANFLIRHPQHFRVVKGSSPAGDVLELVAWDESLAVTAREKSVQQGQVQKHLSPWAFVSTFPSKFKADRVFWEEHDRFQRIPFSSPYEQPGSSGDPGTPSGEKRVLAVVHELLSLTVEKRASLMKVMPLKEELLLPDCLDALLACHPRIFYYSFRFRSRMAFLREAYQENHRVSVMKVKDPLVTVRNRYVGLLRVEYREPRKTKPCVFSTDSDESDEDGEDK